MHAYSHNTTTTVKSLMEKMEESHQATKTKVALRMILRILHSMGILNTRSTNIRLHTKKVSSYWSQLHSCMTYQKRPLFSLAYIRLAVSCPNKLTPTLVQYPMISVQLQLLQFLNFPAGNSKGRMDYNGDEASFTAGHPFG